MICVNDIRMAVRPHVRKAEEAEPEKVEPEKAEPEKAEPEMAVEEEIETPVDDRIKELIEDRATTIENRIEELENELTELENFATITLRDRRIAENSDNISKVSDSFSGFAESTTDKLNSLEHRLEINTLLLATIAEAVADTEDVDLSAVRQYQEDRLVTNISADERLEEALEQLTS